MFSRVIMTHVLVQQHVYVLGVVSTTKYAESVPPYSLHTLEPVKNKSIFVLYQAKKINQ